MTVFGIWDYVMYLPANPKGGQERLRRRAEHAPIPERFPDRIERFAIRERWARCRLPFVLLEIQDRAPRSLRPEV